MIINYYIDKPYNSSLSSAEKVELEKIIADLKLNKKPVADKLLDSLFNRKPNAIYLYAQVGSVRVKAKTGLRILPKHWDFESQEVKKSSTGHNEFNQVLRKLKSDLHKNYLERAALNPINSIDELRLILSESIEQKELKDVRKDFYEAFDQFVEIKAATKSSLTIKKYKTLLRLITEFEESKKYPISLNSINLRFNDHFSAYLMIDEKQTNNTVGKYISTLKTFMHWATDRGLNQNKEFTRFKVLTERADIVCLTEEELMSLYNHDFSDNKTLDKVRDMFCFACFTGQRFSDLQNLRWEDIKGKEWQLRTAKTKDIIKIFLIDYALEILKKYEGGLAPLPIMSNQKSNFYIKEACKAVGIDEVVTKVLYRGSERIEFREARYKFVSFHTGRRSFCTINLQKKVSTEMIMRVTGHKDHKVFRKYIGLTSRQVAEEFHNVWNK